MKIVSAFVLSLAVAVGAPPAAFGQAPSARPELVIQMGHTIMVGKVAVSPDGKYVVTGAFDKSAKLWNLATGEEIRTFSGHTDGVYALAFTPDGKYLVSASLDQTAKVWELATGKELLTFSGHADAIPSVAVTPDGKFAVTGANDRTAMLWNIKTGALVRTFKGHTNWVFSVAVSPDGRTLATGSWDSTARLWSLATGKTIRTFRGHAKNVNSVAFSRDGKRLATGSDDRTAKLWDVATGRALRTFKGHAAEVTSLALVRDGKSLVTGSVDGTAKLWDLATGAEIRTFKGHEQPVMSVALTPDGKTLVTGSVDGTAKLWDLATGAEIRTLKGHASPLTSVSLSADGKSLATGSWDRVAVVWDLSIGAEARTFKGLGAAKRQIPVALSPNGKYLAAGDGNNAKTWEAATGKEATTLSGHTDKVNSVAFSADGKSLFTGSLDKTAKQWDAETGAEIRTFSGHEQSVYAAAPSPDGKILATVADFEGLKVWDVATGAELRTIKAHQSRTPAVAVSPDGAFAVTGSWDQTAKQWNLATGEEVHSFEGHADKVESVAISPDGKFAATGSWDNTAKIWDLSTGRETLTLKGHTSTVYAVAFAPDGRRLVTASVDGTARFWDLAAGRELARLVALDDGWVVVTPDGYFDGSPEGMKRIHWTVGLQSFPLEAFSEGYYVPGLLAHVLAGEKIAGGRSLSQGFALPPLVKILSPKNEASLEGDAVDVTVEAADQGGGVDEIRLYQNGKALGEDARGMKGAGRTQTFHATLAEGRNVFRAVALSRDRIESNPDEIAVTLKGAEKPAALHVVAVGVNKYKNGALDLNYARPDAQGISDFFAAAPQGLFRSVDAKNLFDADATKAGVLGALADLKSAPPEDVVVIYLAGHGESLGNTWYFIPYDLVYPEDEDQVKAKGLSSAELVAAVGNIRAQKVVILLDACKSGEAMLAFAGRGLEDRKALKQLARAAGVHVMAASTKDQIAAEVKELGHGVFTYTLLNGLKGAADAAHTGTVTVGALLTYVENELPEVSQKYKAEAQYPVRDERGMDFPISTAR